MGGGPRLSHQQSASRLAASYNNRRLYFDQNTLYGTGVLTGDAWDPNVIVEDGAFTDNTIIREDFNFVSLENYINFTVSGNVE